MIAVEENGRNGKLLIKIAEGLTGFIPKAYGLTVLMCVVIFVITILILQALGVADGLACAIGAVIGLVVSFWLVPKIVNFVMPK